MLRTHWSVLKTNPRPEAVLVGGGGGLAFGSGGELGSGPLQYGCHITACSHTWPLPPDLIGKKVQVVVDLNLAPVETVSKTVEVRL